MPHCGCVSWGGNTTCPRPVSSVLAWLPPSAKAAASGGPPRSRTVIKNFHTTFHSNCNFTALSCTSIVTASRVYHASGLSRMPPPPQSSTQRAPPGCTRSPGSPPCTGPLPPYSLRDEEEAKPENNKPLCDGRCCASMVQIRYVIRARQANRPPPPHRSCPWFVVLCIPPPLCHLQYMRTFVTPWQLLHCPRHIFTP